MNVEQAREVPHAAHDSLFAITEQIQLPHTAICQAVKISYKLQQAGWSLCVGFVYVVSEDESLMYGGF